jgi:hypothetical protein
MGDPVTPTQVVLSVVFVALFVLCIIDVFKEPPAGGPPDHHGGTV